MNFWSKRFWQLFTVVGLFFFNSKAQVSHEADSLTKIVNDPATHDTVKIKLYGDIAWSLLGSDLNRALENAKLELAFAIKTQRIADVAQAFSDIGSIYNRKAVYDSSLANYYKALILRQQLQQEKKVAGIYANIATVYMRRSDFKKALDINFRSLAIFEKYDDPSSVINQGLIFGNIGNLYYELEMNKAAEEFYRKGLAIAEKYNDVNSAINHLVNIGGIKFEYQNVDSALYYFLEAENRASEVNQLYSLAAIYNDLGKVYVAKKQYPTAIDYYKKGLKVREDLGDQYGIGLSLSNIGEVYSFQKRHIESLEYLRKAEEALLELKNYVSLHNVYAKMASAYAAVGDFENSVTYMEKYAGIKDSIYNRNNTEKLTEMQVKYEAEKKEKENLKLQNENTEKDLQISQRSNIIIISFSVFAVVLLSSFFIYWRNKLKQKQRFDAEMLREQEMRNKAIIEAEEKERIRIARDLHDGVGQLLSAAKLNLSKVSSAVSGAGPAAGGVQEKFMVNALKMIDDSVREVRSISHNLMPGVLSKHGLKEAVSDFAEKINSTGALEIQTEFSGTEYRLDQTKELVIYRVLQELVSNCLKHSGATTLTLQVVGHENELTIMVEDNGRGFDTSLLNTAKGIGLKNIISRIGFLNGTVDFDSRPGSGTTVVIEIPFSGQA